MSQKGRLRQLEAGVCWLETEGRFRRIKNMMKIVEMLQQFADRSAVDPEFAARWKKDFPNFPYVLPPPSAHLRPRPPNPAVASPPPVLVAPPPPVDVEPLAAPPAVIAAPPAPVPKTPPPPLPGMPVSPPSPDMEIRPVRWREHGSRGEGRGNTYGRCLTEYDALRDEDDDDDDG